MRSPTLRASFLRPGELVVDCFAGGGGASTGIEAAIGRSPDIAINHSRVAIAMHRRNHPATRHFCEDVWKVDPKKACEGRPVGLAWFSPDCRHFSKAKGSKPVSKKIRGLAWTVTRWARAVQPRVIVVENVEEFQTWGPLRDDSKPDPKRAGETFRAWLGQLRRCGYRIEFRLLTAADYGAPTTRRRLFLVARRDDAPIVWPAATHGRGRARGWRPAAEVIDWSLPCPSIFDRRRPLKPATLRRIAEGLRRYVLECPRPFIVGITHTKSGTGRVQDSLEPLRTITTAKGGEFALVSPTLIQTGYGERPGQAPRVPGLGKPLGTVVAGGSKHALVAAFLSKHYGGAVGQPVDHALGTVTAKDHHSLSFAFLTKFFGTSTGSSMSEPLPTVTAGGGKGGGHLAEVRAFVVKYYGTGGQTQDLFSPLHTVTSKARFGLVTIQGEQFEIADIGLRMLAPHELFAAQGFPADYEISVVDGKRLSKTEQIALAGNSVPPPVAEAIVAAQLGSDARAEVA